MAGKAERIVLASASTARAALLSAAGIAFEIVPAMVDEAVLKRRARAAGESPIACALVLAQEKACEVSRRFPEALVIGADQILAAGSEWFDKPPDIDAARIQLCKLRNRVHALATAVCVAFGGQPLWHATSQPQLAMRAFSEGFLNLYLVTEGEALLGTVGAYRIEGRGAQLFSHVEGDYFAVLGLPLIELLEFLRDRGAIAN